MSVVKEPDEIAAPLVFAYLGGVIFWLFAVIAWVFYFPRVCLIGASMPFHSHKLPNGLQLIGETSPSARSVAVGFFVRTGSRGRNARRVRRVALPRTHDVQGHPAAHRVRCETSDFDRIGASYNAYTSEENTVYYAGTPPGIPAARNRHPRGHPAAEPPRRGLHVPKERDPRRNRHVRGSAGFGGVGPAARRIYYKTHPLGNSVLGTKESVGALTRDQMHAYFSRRYAANNIVVSAAGNYDWNAFVKLITDACSGWNTDKVGRDHRTEWLGDGGEFLLTR